MRYLAILSAVMFFALSLPAASETGVRIVEDVVYASVGERDLHMDLAIPDGDKNAKKPVIVWIHGGGWKKGNQKPNRAARFAKEGFVTASIEYRFSTEAVFPAQIHDCKAAIRYLRANAEKYGIDPNRIGVWGGSSGGHLAALLGTSSGIKELEGNYGNTAESSRVQAVCEFYGPVDFTATDRKPEPGRKKPTPVAQLLGGTAKEKPELARLASPVYQITKDDPPFLIFHGDADEMVPISQSEKFTEALRKAGVEVTIVKVKNGNHGLTAKDQDLSLKQIEKRVLEFFEKQFKVGTGA